MKTKREMQKLVRECLLCDEGACAAACPRGIKPDRILRAQYFENEKGAVKLLTQTDACADCSGECEKACVKQKAGESSVKIRRILKELQNLSAGQGEQEAHDKPDLSVNVCGVIFENPFLLSSSVVASSYEMIARAFDMGWAGAAYKTLCCFIPKEASPRFAAYGREQREFYGFKNIEQLSGNSVETDLEIVRRLKQEYPKKVLIVSIMGRDENEWSKLAEAAAGAGADIIECNFSCPHMAQHGIGSDVGQNPELVKRYTEAVKNAVHIPVWAKMTPNITDMVPAACAAVDGGADGIAAINTIKSIMGMNPDTMVTEPDVNGYSGTGGYSGRAVKPIALRFILDMAQAPGLCGVPVSGMGGIETWKDAAEFLLLGASTVQITTAVMQYGYRIIDDLLDGLSGYMEEKGFASLDEVIGGGVKHVIPQNRLDTETIQYPKFNRKSCVGCGRCRLSCLDGGHQAITMEESEPGERYPRLDVKKCVGCQLCVLVCPVEAIGRSVRQAVTAV